MKKKLIKFITITLCSLFAFSSLGSLAAEPLNTEITATSVPKSTEEVSRLEEQALNELHDFIKFYTAIETRDFDNTITNWNKVIDRLNNYNSLLVTLGIVNDDEKVIEAGKESAVKLTSAIILNIYQNILPTIVAYLENTPLETLSPAQKHIAYIQLSELYSSKLPEEMRTKVEKLKQLLNDDSKEEFIFLKGNAEEKIQNTPNFSILNLNVCGFGDVLPKMYGGPKPWKERIDSLAGRIQTADADVIAFQEVFDPEMGRALYDRLKDQYAYFYTEIGPRVDVVGISSGLFVASKYKIENPKFTLFADREVVRGYGFFDFYIKSGNQTLGHITTTHLQPFESEASQELRQKELQQIVNHLNVQTQDKDIPFFICGDLNIQWGSNEPAEQVLKENFIDSYNKDRTSITEESRTCLDFTKYWKDKDPNGFEKIYELIDYALLFNTDGAQKYEMETTRVPMGEVTAESVPDSDHDGLLSNIKLIQ